MPSDWPVHITFTDVTPSAKFVTLPEDKDENEMEEWLLVMLAEGVSNIHISECFVEAIVQPSIHNLVVLKGYKVLARPLINKSAMAEFFFVRDSA